MPHCHIHHRAVSPLTVAICPPRYCRVQSRVSDPRLLDTWNTAAHYHLLHSVVLTMTPLLSPTHTWSTRLLTSGMVLFSGSLYTMVLTNQRKLGAITPIGGLALIGGWLALAARK